MKKLSSMLALSLVLTMVLGMTAFAQGESPNTRGSAVTEGVKLQDSSVNSEDVTASKTEAETAVSGKAKSGTLKEVYAFELSGTVPADHKVQVKLPEGTTASSKLTYVALHKRSSDGKWETLNAKLQSDGSLVIEGVTEFSPFIIYCYETDTRNNNADDDDYEPYTASVPVSPKTGETMPVAAVIALSALAGAAVMGSKRAFVKR